MSNNINFPVFFIHYMHRNEIINIFEYIVKRYNFLIMVLFVETCLLNYHRFVKKCIKHLSIKKNKMTVINYIIRVT